MQYLGETGIPFSIVFTKTDKLNSYKLSQNIIRYKNELAKVWEEIPKTFVTSAESKTGKDEILEYIHEINEQLGADFMPRG
jgi:GTP-binding protein